MTLDSLISVLREEATRLDEAVRAIERLMEAIGRRKEAADAFEMEQASDEQRAAASDIVQKLQQWERPLQ